MEFKIYSFNYKKSTVRYFQIWDKSTGLPETVPMDLITLILYKGLKDKNFINYLKNSYPVLLSKGGSFSGETFEELSKEFKNQAFEYLDLFNNENIYYLNEHLNDIEKLFSKNIDFEQFYSKLKEFFLKHKITLNYPAYFYRSWSYTNYIFTEKNWDACFSFTKDFFNRNGIPSEPDNQELEFNSIFRLAQSSKHKSTIKNLFCELAERNLIEISSIPHQFRNDSKISKLFISYDMSDFLANVYASKNFDTKSLYRYKTYRPSSKRLRQMLNFARFSDFGVSDSLQDYVFHKMNYSDLCNLASDNYMQLITSNFESQYGIKKYPFIYCDNFQLNNEKPEFIFLAKFGFQFFNVFLHNGELIDESGYFDVETIDETSYNAVCEDGYTAVNCKYDYKNRELSRTFINNYLIQAGDYFNGSETLENPGSIMLPEKPLNDDDDLPF